MFKRNKKPKLDAKVKYQQPKFKQKLAKARSYQRPTPGSSRAHLSRFWFFLRAANWRLIAISVLLLAAFIYVSFIENIFFVQEIVVRGGSSAVQGEVKNQVLRYVDGRSFIFPNRNLLFTGKSGLSHAILQANFHVWKVERVQKKWPHTLEVSVLPREPQFLWSDGLGQVLVANDGIVLPLNERGEAPVLPLFGRLANSPQVGERFISEEVISSLSAIKNNFTAVVNLPPPTQVEMVPVIVAKQPLSDLPQTPALEPVSSEQLETVLDVAPKELRAYIPAFPTTGTSAFVVLFDVSTTPEALEKLHVLLAQQSPDRLSRLAYVDMRFINKAFICLANTPCAKDTPALPPSSITPAKIGP